MTDKLLWGFMHSSKFFQVAGLCLLLLVTPLWAEKIHFTPLKTDHLPKRVRKAIKPYLLPPNHPMRANLDILFSKARVTRSKETLRAAGFKIISCRPRSFIYVLHHPQLPGYLVKLSLDSDTRIKENKETWQWFVRRCEGAKIISNAIQKLGNPSPFVVPGKWIYPLPHGKQKKHVILLVQDMHLAPKSANYKAWKSKITPDFLQKLYRILQRAPSCSFRADNIALTQRGQFAFIDTEYRDVYFGKYRYVRKYLSPEMQRYWDQLTHRKR